jgi:hypothetical protein
MLIDIININIFYKYSVKVNFIDFLKHKMTTYFETKEIGTINSKAQYAKCTHFCVPISTHSLAQENHLFEITKIVPVYW